VKSVCCDREECNYFVMYEYLTTFSWLSTIASCSVVGVTVGVKVRDSF